MANNSPRISLSIGRVTDGPRTVGDINPYGMMLTIYLLLLFLTVLNPLSASNALNLGAFSSGVSHRSFILFGFLISNSISLFALGIISSTLKKGLSESLLVILSSSLTATGSACLLATCFINSLWLAVLGSVLIGVGSSFFLIIFGKIYTQFKYATIILNAVLSFSFASIVSVVLISWITAQLSAGISVVLSVLIAFGLKNTNGQNLLKETIGEDEVLSNSPKMAAYSIRCWISLILLGIVLGALQTLCCEGLLSLNSISINLVLCSGTIISILVFVIALVTSGKEVSWDHLFRVISPIIMICIALIAFSLGNGFFAALCLSLAFICLDVLLWIFLSNLTKDMNVSVAKIFGIGGGFIQVGTIVGSLAFYLIVHDSSNTFSLSLLSMFKSSTSSISGDIANLNMFEMQYRMALFAVALITITALANAIQPRYYELKNLISGVLRQSMIDNGAELTAVGEELTSAPFKLAQNEETEARETKGRFQRKCELIAENCKLSKREIDVFRLLAKGHNAAFIMDRLCISRSTAKTHINHIYKKTSVHTQQELLALIEKTSLDTDASANFSAATPQHHGF